MANVVIIITRTLVRIMTAFLWWKMHKNKDKQGTGNENMVNIRDKALRTP